MSPNKPDRTQRSDPAIPPHVRRNSSPADGAPARSYLVEHYWPGVTEDSFRAVVDRVRRASEALTEDGRPVRYVHSTFVPGDESALCVFEAESDAEVRQAYEMAGVRFERIVLAVKIDLSEPVTAKLFLTD